MTCAALDAVSRRPARSVRIQAAISAAAVTIPHALGLGLVAFSPLAGQLPVGSLALWSAAVPGAAATLLSLRSGVFGLGAWQFGFPMAEHFLAAVAVVIIALLSARRWPRLPGLLPGAAGVAVVLWAVGLAPQMAAAAPLFPFALPPLPDYSGVPWTRLVDLHGTQLVSLALLMAVVNSLDVVVFKQELDLEHGLRTNANTALRRESLVGAVCGLCGFIHCLSGALLLAGYTQIPRLMWSRAYATNAPASWSQSWLVALVFSAAGGAGALMAGLVVATFVLLHASANSALRRAHLDGQMRSRRLPLGERELAQVQLGVPVFADLDRALEWAEEALLQERPRSAAPARQDESPLGELGEGLSPAGHEALAAMVQRVRMAAGDPLFAAGDAGREVFIVEKGKVALATTWPPEAGIRLASIGPGMPFGEMAFPTRLAATTRQLRAALG